MDPTTQPGAPGTAYARRVGERLRLIRRQQQLSLQEVEARSDGEFRASVLGAYERGERSISVPRLQRLARFYAVPVDQLLPADPVLDPGSASGSTATDALGASAPLAAVVAGLDPDLGVGLSETDAGGAGDGAAREGHVTLDLARMQQVIAPELAVFRRWAAAVQLERQDFNGRVLSIRQEDLRAISYALGMEPDAVTARLDQLGVSCIA